MIKMATKSPRLRKRASPLVRLLRNRSGIAMTEFAIILPVLMVLTSSGLEIANFLLVKRRVSDVAVQVSDNASRLGLQSALATKQIREVDINDVFLGAQLHGGNIDIENNGRIILSSLEVNADGGQWIHWQRCYGKLAKLSTYGNEGDGSAGKAFPGMGPAGRRIQASPGTAVMFVEIAFKYKPLIGFTPYNFGTLHDFASFNVRDNRDLTKVYNPLPSATVSKCA